MNYYEQRYQDEQKKNAELKKSLKQAKVDYDYMTQEVRVENSRMKARIESLKVQGERNEQLHSKTKYLIGIITKELGRDDVMKIAEKYKYSEEIESWADNPMDLQE